MTTLRQRRLRALLFRFLTISPFLAFSLSPAAAGEEPPPPAEVALSEERSVARLADRIARMIPRREFAAALAAIDQALTIDPAYIPVWRLKGVVHIELGQNEDAEEALAVCLLGNPGDVEANLLSLINTLRRRDMSDSDKIRRVGDDMDRAGPALFSDMIARFAARPDFPEHLSPLLAAWRRTGTPLDTVKKALRFYYDGNFDEASQTLREPEGEPVPPVLASALAALIERADGGRSLTLWSVDAGRLERGNDELFLTAEPLSHAFAWLRTSPGRRNVDVTVAFAATAPELAQSLYLRHSSTESYLRVTLADSMLTLQERIPGLGLSTMFDYPEALLESRPVRIVLKGDRATLFAGAERLTETPLPVSVPGASGKLALGCENRSSREALSAGFYLDIARLDPRWRRLPPTTTPAELRAVADDPAVSGVIIPVGGEASRQQVVSALLTARNAGMAAIAELPEGEPDFSLVAKSVECLPAVLAGRAWTAVAIRPGPAPDWDAVRRLAERAGAAGLRMALIPPPSAPAVPAGADIRNIIALHQTEPDVYTVYTESLLSDNAFLVDQAPINPVIPGIK